MNQSIEQVTIVGGGTAGWLTAMILNTFLNARGDEQKVRITLIESPNIPTIGVGEATVIGLAAVMQQMEVDEAELIRRTNAAFKLSVKFSNWSLDAAGHPVIFYHPFN